MAVLDTSFLIDLEQRRPRALARLEALERDGHPLRIPAAAWVEYLSGLPPQARLLATRKLESSAYFEPFGREYADEAARMNHELGGKGRRLGGHDLQIVATASYLEEPVVSNDAALAKVPGIEILRH